MDFRPLDAVNALRSLPLPSEGWQRTLRFMKPCSPCLRRCKKLGISTNCILSGSWCSTSHKLSKTNATEILRQNYGNTKLKPTLPHPSATLPRSLCIRPQVFLGLSCICFAKGSFHIKNTSLLDPGCPLSSAVKPHWQCKVVQCNLSASCCSTNPSWSLTSVASWRSQHHSHRSVRQAQGSLALCTTGLNRLNITSITVRVRSIVRGKI